MQGRIQRGGGVTPSSPQTLSAKLCPWAKNCVRRQKAVSVGKMMKGQWRRYASDKIIIIIINRERFFCLLLFTFWCANFNGINLLAKFVKKEMKGRILGGPIF